MPGPEVKSQDNKLCANLFIGFIGCFKVLGDLACKLNPTQWFAVWSQSHQGTINTRVNNCKLTCWVSYFVINYYISLLFAINSYSFNPMLLVSYLDK
jgi:hypothetical protein